MNYEPYTGRPFFSTYPAVTFKIHFKSKLQMDSKFLFFSSELKSILGHSGKRKAHELVSDGPSFKRQANVHPHLLVSL